ncbi:MAG: FecR family protein [Candidatus Cryptobacteroides sp.]
MEPEIFNSLLSYFEGRLSDSEAEDICRWIDEDESHREFAREAYLYWTAEQAMKSSRDGSTEIALSKVYKRSKEARRKHYSRIYQRIAAVLLLPLLIASAIMVKNSLKTDPVQMIEVRTTAGMTSTVVLPDSSTVWLNSGSVLRYPSSFSNTRDVELLGEGYFKVTKDPDHSFHVKTSAMTIEVVGTEFNVDAYGDEGRSIRTTLVNGAINMHYLKDNSKEEVMKIYPGQCVSIDPVEKKISVQTLDPNTMTAWRYGKIIMNRTPIEDALRQIENRYNVRFVIKNPQIYGQKFTGQLSDQRLEVMLDFFSRTSSLKFKRISRDKGIITGPEIIEVYI